MALYLGSYALVVKRESHLTFRGDGPLFYEARYVAKDSRLPFPESAEQAAEVIYWPAEWLDRQARPDYWEAALPPPVAPPPMPIETRIAFPFPPDEDAAPPGTGADNQRTFTTPPERPKATREQR